MVRRSQLLWGLLVFAIVAGVGCGDAADTPAPPAAAPAAAPSAPPAAAPAAPPVAQAAEPERFRIPVTPAEPARGADAPRVTIVEFSDFQCPFCTRVEPTIEAVLKEYDGKVRVVWRNNPLPMHPNAIPAAEAAMAAFAQGGNEKFWAMHGKLFANQQALGRPDLERYAGELGLDLDSFKQALDQRAAQKQIAADQALAQRMGASATPAFFVNGRFLSGAQPLEAFKTVIDDELQRAEKLTASGTSPSDLYDALTKNGLEAAQPKAAAPARPQQDPAAVYKVPVDKAPQQGPSDALVTIVEFSDYQCPFSRKAQPTLAQIIQTYGKDVRHVYRNNPLAMHNHAALAAEAALAARDQDKFWEYHDRLFANQQALAREDLEQYATELGLDMAKFKAALDTNAHKDEIAADQQLTRSLGQTGTPAFFVNGRSVKGARPFDAFKALIDEELQKARDLVAKGTPQDQVYGKIIENGATAPKFLEGAAAAAAAAAPPPPDPNKIYALTVPADAPARGSPDARVVIQEFADFQCPFCGRVSPTVKQVMQEYGDSVRFVWRNYPLRFHANAQKASEAAVEVQAQGGEEKFWQYHDLLLQNQNALTPQDLVRYAEQIGGIDTQALKAALDSDKHKARVQADVDAIGAAGAQIGTPSFFINGKLLQGALPMESFKAAIDKAMAEAK